MLTFLVVADGRSRTELNFAFRGPTGEIIGAINRAIDLTKLHDAVGVARIEIVQPVDMDFTLAGGIGGRFFRESGLRAQNRALSAALERYARAQTYAGQSVGSRVRAVAARRYPWAMPLTDYHAKYLAHDLTRRCATDSVEKLAAVLADAQVDLNPHQVEAALFAFQSPFSKGAILADEVGLGKTIEAGLLLAQKWAERKRRLLVIVPANLRKQWSQELADKFFLPSAILEARTFNEAVRAGNLNPFQQDDGGPLLLSVRAFEGTLSPTDRRGISWSSTKPTGFETSTRTRARSRNAIKQAVAPFPKVLLTATPLQNSLLELYGLVSIIDDYAFGDLESYRTQFARLTNDGNFAELKERLAPICKRTLRRQVLEYVKYTDRHALVQEFVPTPRSNGSTIWCRPTSSVTTSTHSRRASGSSSRSSSASSSRRQRTRSPEPSSDGAATARRSPRRRKPSPRPPPDNQRRLGGTRRTG